MCEDKKALPGAGLDSCAQNAENAEEQLPQPASLRAVSLKKTGDKTAENRETVGAIKKTAGPTAAPREYETDCRERWCLPWALLVCVLGVDVLLFHSAPGAGVLVLVLAWYVLLYRYLGPQRRKSAECRFLLVINLLLAATFALGSNWYFRTWNLGALALLLPLHALALSGTAQIPWWKPGMIPERIGLFFCGVFGNLGALGPVLRGKGKRRVWPGILGGCAALGLLLILLPVLASADALFEAFAGDTLLWFRTHLSTWVARLLLGAALTPFCFSLLYDLRRPRQRTEKAARQMALEALPALIVLGALVALYALFLGVQAAGLFGGAAYLEQKGISYAAWARSGFFQLTGVVILNVTVLLTAVGLFQPKRLVCLLGTVLVGESGLLLASAAWRMGLYVGVYGLSFKRIMTYWGMAVMAVFLLAALLRLWRSGFAFYRVAFLTAALAWVAISFTPVDHLVAKDNVERYLNGESVSVSVAYLLEGLSYDTLHQLNRLEGTELYTDWYQDPWTGESCLLPEGIACRQQMARKECAAWESWNLSAYLAGRE